MTPCNFPSYFGYIYGKPRDEPWQPVTMIFWGGTTCLQPIWVFPKIAVPQNGWFIMENPLKWMIWGTPIVWKHPYHVSGRCWHCSHQKIHLTLMTWHIRFTNQETNFGEPCLKTSMFQTLSDHFGLSQRTPLRPLEVDLCWPGLFGCLPQTVVGWWRQDVGEKTSFP